MLMMEKEENNRETRHVMKNKRTADVPCLQPRSLKRRDLVQFLQHLLLLLLLLVLLPLKWILSMGWSNPSQIWVKKPREIAGFAILHWTRPTMNLVSLLSWAVLCKDDLAAAHKHCAEAWFKIKGNRTCEICGSTARNVAAAAIDTMQSSSGTQLR
ncbi:hypothetical protein GQ457_09G030190 [Hibiscus cannabinus]